MKFEMGGEVKREVAEAMGNRGGGRCGTGRVRGGEMAREDVGARF
jgi:hypothetical protein